jgi:formylglycine-generating enzyme required for sulfatase activity
MHGNAAEWTRSTYRTYPYVDEPIAESPSNVGRKVVRGGSWRDLPKHATSSYRLSYLPYQRVFNVGFRVVAPAVGPAIVSKVAVDTSAR